MVVENNYNDISNYYHYLDDLGVDNYVKENIKKEKKESVIFKVYYVFLVLFYLKLVFSGQYIASFAAAICGLIFYHIYAYFAFNLSKKIKAKYEDEYYTNFK